MEMQIPIGIIHRMEKGKYKILELGKIMKENEDGIFVVSPYKLNNDDDKVEKLRAEFFLLTKEEQVKFFKVLVKKL